jgi:hypothetical protein
MSESNQNPFETAWNAEPAGNPFGEPTAPLAASTIPAPPPRIPQPSAELDLGSEDEADDPFATSAKPTTPLMNPAPTTAQITPPAAQPAPTQEAVPTVIPPAAEMPVTQESEPEPEPDENPLADAMGMSAASIFAQPPVFEHGAVTEDIADITQTFEQLRAAKAADFPELEDANRVSWRVTYGKVTKILNGADAKKNKIGEYKASLEASKEFMDALKKSKDKAPRCVVKPEVRAQSKGDALPAYKGIFTDLSAALSSDKVISIVPGRDGYLYEIRREDIGTFTTRTLCRELPEVRAGFIPALPPIPQALTLEIISFFRSMLREDGNYEAIVNILWDKELKTFCAYVPAQTVTRTRAVAEVNNPNSDRFLHYMDVHSHNVMPAKFSGIDDADEKATRVYAVFGRLDRFLPQISVRISNGGKYLAIDPALVFEPLGKAYPASWDALVTVCDAEEMAA